MDKQQIMAKYAKLVMRKLYNADIKVFFREVEGLRGIFRSQVVPPYSYKDMKAWEKKPFCSITFNQALYGKDDIMPHAWDTIIHEISHYDKNDSSYTTNNFHFKHSAGFREIVKQNKEKVKELRKEFWREVKQGS